MSDGRPFHLVDVFTEEPYAGNQLAVVRDAGGLSDDEMQALAREMAYSETTFVESETAAENDGWDVRIFTPESEIPFAGHPTLGTAAVIRDELAASEARPEGAPRNERAGDAREHGRPDEVTLNLGVGEIPVTVAQADDGEVLWMRQRLPEFGETMDADEAAEVVSVGIEDVTDDYPAQVVSTGLPTLVVPLRSLDAVRDAEINGQAYRERVVRGLDAENVLVFAPETYHDDNDLNVRMFAPALGVPEDPATGSSNGCLAGWLARHRYFESPEVAVRVEQGYEIDRPSLLHLEATDDGDEVTVEVGGRVVPVADGELL
jgi:trans-2,3-dihydro-3-hydroxyanthranilate isomerase